MATIYSEIFQFNISDINILSLLDKLWNSSKQGFITQQCLFKNGCASTMTFLPSHNYPEVLKANAVNHRLSDFVWLK